MKRTSILNKSNQNRIIYEQAVSSFNKYCVLKNLRPSTLEYYNEDLSYFYSKISVKYIDEVTQEVYDSFLYSELEEGKKVSSLNTRIRGLRVFFKFCADREYMNPINAPLMKQDEEIKEPYTDDEISKLLARPRSDRWVEWRTWAMVNYLIATGNRASTVAGLKIEDINFDAMTIFLRKVKNRKQQIVPLSPALKSVLLDYLNTWEWKTDDYLFPAIDNRPIGVRGMQNALKKYNVARGVSKTSIHLFRHTFAKNYILAGGGMVQLQALLGHSTLDMTRHYVNLYGMDLNRGYENLNPLDTFMKKHS